MAKINENTIIGIPILKSKRLCFIFEILAPAILTVLINKPIGFAELMGIPMEIIIGTKITAEPIPPKEKTNEAINAIINIKNSIYILLFVITQLFN